MTGLADQLQFALHLVPAIAQPVVEPRPEPDQRLMYNVEAVIERRRARALPQQPGDDKSVQHRGNFSRRGQRLQLLPAHTAANEILASSGLNEAPEDPFRDAPLPLRQAAVDRLSALLQCLARAPHFAVGIEADAVALAPLPETRERELQQRQRLRVALHLADEFSHEAFLKGQAGDRGRTLNRRT